MRNLTIHCTTLATVMFFVFSPAVVAQTEYQLLAPLPLEETRCIGNETGDNACKTTAMPYLRGIFILAIAIAGGLAVIMIIFGGIKYMSTDAFGGKSEAKDTIQNAIWGLLLAISAWLILYTVNPDLIKFDLRIPKLSSSQTLAGGPRPGTTPPPFNPANCADCGITTVRHKAAPDGCAAPGPCIIDRTLNEKLVALNKLNSLLVTESCPPTIKHQATCHLDCTCVDATSAVDTKTFINNARTTGLRAVFEVESETRAQTVRRETGLSKSEVIAVPGIKGEHYSVYLK